jgi:2-dehydropantoate 2-reductase
VSLQDAVKLIVEESVRIAAGEGVELDSNDLLDMVWKVARATKDNKSSMLQDLERGRKTEIDAINGALVEIARRHGVASPLNELLRLLVRAAETKQMRKQI